METAADMAHGVESGAGVDEPVGHVVPNWILVGTWLALIALTWITVAVSWVHLGELNLWVALIIATMKASLVVLFFMHMRWTKPFNAVVLIISLLGVSLLIGFTLTDTTEYAPDLIPHYAPAINK